MAKEILITDFGCAQPKDMIIDSDSMTFMQISAKSTGHWRLIDYTTDLFSGRFLSSNRPDVPPLAVPLNLRGYYAISIGIAGTGGRAHEGAIEVRLSGDSKWQLIKKDRVDSIIEEPWIIADITGKDLEIRYPSQDLSSSKVRIARLFSIRLAAVDQKDVNIIENREKRKVMFINDGWIYCSKKQGNEFAKDAFSPFFGSEWETCCFGLGGSDIVLYDTKIGTIIGEDGWDLQPEIVEQYKNIKSMINDKIDPMKAAIDQAHSQDNSFIVYMRNQLWACEPPDDHIRSKFYINHPEFSCLEADGKVLRSKLSIGFKEVRRQMNAILKECLEKGADGVALCFVRGFPLVRYEQPVLDLYEKEYGGDGRQVKSDDERIRRVWSMIVTQWISEIRQILDDAGPSLKSKRRQLGIFCGPNIEWNLQYGIDVELWAKEKLIDIVIPYPREVEDNYEILKTKYHGENEGHQLLLRKGVDSFEAFEIGVKEYAEALKDTNVELLPSMGSCADHDLTLFSYRKRAHTLYKAGATGLSRWDTDGWMANLFWDEPQVQKIWVEKYMPPVGNKVISMAGLERILFSPRISM